MHVTCASNIFQKMYISHEVMGNLIIVFIAPTNTSDAPILAAIRNPCLLHI